MTTIAALPDAAVPSPSGASLAGLDGINFFNAAMLAGFGPYVAVYLAEQKWTQENIGFVLTAGGLAGLLALIPGGELLDAVRSKRALVALGAIMVAVSAFVIGIWPNVSLVFTARCCTEPLAPSSGRRSPRSASASLGNPYQRFGSAEERDGSIELISVPFPTRLHLP